ncbi:MAG: hypothetical protein M3Y41_12700 [Pseudomonadota bacterium]|nr:hypothetical protein [Pseudomonadota bacterium]
MFRVETHRTAEDERTIRQVVASRPWPEAVEDVELEFGEDSSGDPAVWVWLLVAPDLEPPAATMRELSDFAQSIRWGLTEPDLKHWPYVGFRTIETDFSSPGWTGVGVATAEPSWLRFC